MSVPRTVGLLTPFVVGEYLGEIVARVCQSARAHGARLLTIRTGDTDRFDLPVAWDLVDGWISLVNPVAPGYLKRLLDRGKPVVSIAHDVRDARAVLVESDNEASVAEAVSEMIRAGHRHIAFIGYLTEYDIAKRHAGYRRALERHDIAYRPEYVIDTKDYWQGGGVQAARLIVERKLPVTAVFAGTDHNAAGALTCFVDLGLRVPEDIAVIGYDNTSLSRTCDPPLASIDQNFDELAERAVGSVLAQLERGTLLGGRELVPNIFVPRRSSGLAERSDLELGSPRATDADEYDIRGHVLNATPETIQTMVKMLVPYVKWRCVGKWDDLEHAPGLVTLRELHDYEHDVTSELELRCELPLFPPLEALDRAASFDSDHFLCVLPILSDGKPLRIVALAGQLSGTRRLVGILKVIDTLAPAFQRSALDEELLAYQAGLEDLVRRRTSELRERTLELELANRAKSTFLTTMSHELRTPLNAVLGYAQLLRRNRELSDEQRAGLETIERSGEHLLTLINDILDLSKIEAGKLELFPGSVNLSAFLRVIVDVIRVKAEQKNLLFKFEVTGPVPAAVEVDERRLRQLLLNLLSNAVKFTDHGFVVFGVHSVQHSEHTARVRFYVRDTGIGISQRELENIFRPFEQASDIERRLQGTGLGLAISRELARLMGAEVHVESRVGEGSLFWFELELVLTAHTDEPLIEREVKGYLGPRKKVLVVDDVTENRQIVMALLSSLGFVVSQATNGAESIEVAAREHPDLIIMDRLMPIMNGLDATRRLRKMAEFRELPILAVSASAAQADEARTLEAGASAFLPKPLEFQALIRKIGALLQLDWDFEQEGAAKAEQEGPLVAPPEQEMTVLRELALAGNMRDVRERANYLMNLDERYRPFASKLRRYAEAYQSKAIVEFVKSH